MFPSSTVHYYFKRFSCDGTLKRAHEALYQQTRQLEGREDSPTFAIIDSQSAKTGPDARGDVGYDAGKKVKGRKRHILVDILGLVLNSKVHSAGIQDRDGLASVCQKVTSRFPFLEVICADGGYQGKIAAKASPRPLQIVKPNQKGFQVLPKRWIVERTFAWLGINRRLSKDLERYAKTTEALMNVAMIKLMVRRIARYGYS
ncbi:IS5 family transposase [Pseudovibrio sp. Alg231-02]|uniref:IS5 family transposase n=1 Tax=Pseudovibrio sp. Alg231-02 TaxID=1922223 RepID=UPI00131EE917|nr:IS5 family transposase [Pseudovibrio sp. Alg231-02]